MLAAAGHTNNTVHGFQPANRRQGATDAEFDQAERTTETYIAITNCVDQAASAR